MENNKVELRRIREFGEVFNATFAFIKQEIKPLGKMLLIFVIPFLLLMNITIFYFFSKSFSSFSFTQPNMVDPSGFLVTFFKLYFVLIAFMLVLQTITLSTVYSYLSLYLKDKENISISAMFSEIIRNFLPVLGGSFIFGLTLLISFFFCFFPIIYMGVSLSLFFVALVIEKNGIFNAFGRSFTLTHKQWGWTFLMIFVSFIMVYVIYIILSIPGFIMGFTSMLHSIKDPVSNPFEKFGLVYIIYSTVVSCITYILYIIPAFLLAFQYFSIVESIEKPSLIEEIENIGKEE